MARQIRALSVWKPEHGDDVHEPTVEEMTVLIQSWHEAQVRELRVKTAILDSIMANVPDKLVLHSNGSILCERTEDALLYESEWVERTTRHLAAVLLNARKAINLLPADSAES
ncbi:hypothetical protein [Mesorhizobium sp. M8A.F.Ca.ET.165.01.1.1]|uniref:hypothetical protein n=1 Tax=Mesorhizobium sp. M8A.F.Ca.ET.165.01.1.1 TaxID=2563960 RepID=UPI001093695E|nr:hypothetical protein [Mesorhizobium sp. M8A.F.Ca.ET.165.01.1.1]TGT42753.1 hypothetical protein EN808_12790 [Mesorhizobium sp. M8A.F.Ca.ET.165.01.1.1]